MALYASIAEFYDEIFPLKQARLVFLDSLLGGAARRILDVGCGTGELALALAKKGHHVQGIDLDAAMIEAARQKAGKQGAHIDFFIKDMTGVGEEFSPGSFDTVLCFGNTLAHLENLENIAVFFRGVHRVLKRGGLVVLQVVNFDRVLAGEVTGLPFLESENFIFRRVYEVDAMRRRVRFLTYLTIKGSGEVRENSHYLFPLTFEELNSVLVSSGFSGQRFWGNESMAPYDKSSPALVAAAFKRD